MADYLDLDLGPVTEELKRKNVEMGAPVQAKTDGVAGAAPGSQLDADRR